MEGPGGGKTKMSSPRGKSRPRRVERKQRGGLLATSKKWGGGNVFDRKIEKGQPTLPPRGSPQGNDLKTVRR